MRKYVTVFLGGLLAACLIVPTFADDFELLFNQVRICVDGNTKTNWDENIKDTDMPSSITYKDTTYVPLRWISDNMDKDVLWNSDSKTVGITYKQNGGGTQFTERADLNGNIWKYRIIITDDELAYISIKDENRRLERRYQLANKNAYRYFEDCVTFIDYDGNLRTIQYLNDENSQDGTAVNVMVGNFSESAKFADDYICYSHNIFGTNPSGEVYVYNIETQETLSHHMYRASDLEILSSDENKIEMYVVGTRGVGYLHEYKLTFDKNSKVFYQEELKPDYNYEEYEEKLSLKNFDFLQENMPMNEIYSRMGKAESETEDDARWSLYKLDDGNTLYLGSEYDLLKKVVLKTSTGTEILIHFDSAGKLNIKMPKY